MVFNKVFSIGVAPKGWNRFQQGAIIKSPSVNGWTCCREGCFNFFLYAQHRSRITTRLVQWVSTCWEKGSFFPLLFFFFACIRRTIGDSFSIFFYDPQKNHDPVSDRSGTSAATCIVQKISDKCFLLLYHTTNVFFFFHSNISLPSLLRERNLF